MTVKFYDKVAENLGLVLEFDFTEAVGTYTLDKSKNHHLGTFVNAPTWKQLASGIWVLTFNGTSQTITVPTSAALNTVFGTKVLTLETLMYPTAATAAYRSIIQKKDANLYVNCPAMIALDFGNIVFSIGDGATSRQLLAPYTLNNWYHAFGVADGTNMYLIVNRVLQAWNTINSNPVPNADQLVIGKYFLRSWFGGDCALIRLYNKGLSVSEVNTRSKIVKMRFGL